VRTRIVTHCPDRSPAACRSQPLGCHGMLAISQTCTLSAPTHTQPHSHPPAPTHPPQVRRGSGVQVVPAEHLVPGDIVLLKSGDKVPADLRLITANNLQVRLRARLCVRVVGGAAA